MRIFRLALVISAALSVLVTVASGQTVVADYQVQDTFNSSVGTIGPLTPVGAGSVTFADDIVDGMPQRVLSIRSGTAAPFPDAGVQTQTTGLLNPANYSIALLANFVIDPLAITATKIFDFKNLSSDAGLYVNTTTGMLAFIDGTGIIQGTGGTPIATLAFVQIVLTRDASTNVASIYQNGALAFSFVDTNGLAIMADATPSGNAFISFFKDDGMGLGGALVAESTQGNIARARLYDGVLSAAQVAALDRAIPEPSTYALLAAGAVALIVRRRRQ